MGLRAMPQPNWNLYCSPDEIIRLELRVLFTRPWSGRCCSTGHGLCGLRTSNAPKFCKRLHVVPSSMLPPRLRHLRISPSKLQFACFSSVLLRRRLRWYEHASRRVPGQIIWEVVDPNPQLTLVYDHTGGPRAGPRVYDLRRSTFIEVAHDNDPWYTITRDTVNALKASQFQPRWSPPQWQ